MKEKVDMWQRSDKAGIIKFKNMKFSKILIVLIFISMLLMLAPLIFCQLPYCVITGDVAQSYKWTFLISQDIKNIAYDTYPKLFPLLSWVFSSIFNISIGAGMYIVTILFDILLPIVMYKLALKLTNHKELSLLSAFFSVVIVIYSSANVGLSTPAPQTITLIMLPLTLYFFITERYILAGIFLGLHVLTHTSWPITFLLIMLYTFLKFYESKKLFVFKPALLSLFTSLLISLPLTIYIYKNAVYNFWAKFLKYINIDQMISFLSFPFSILPYFIIVLGAYGCWRIFKEKKDLNCKFIAFSFLLIIGLSQTYFLNPPSLISDFIYSPSRVLTFLFFPLSILSAVSLSSFLRNKKYIITICLICLLVSVYSYWLWHQKLNKNLDNYDIDLVNFFQKNKDFDKTILYNPINQYGNEWLIIYLGGENVTQSYKGFLLLGNYTKIVYNPVSYVLVKKDDTYMKNFVDYFKNNLTLIHNNSKYNLYKFNPIETKTDEEMLKDYIISFSMFFNQHPKVSNLFENPFMIQVNTKDTKETICLIVYKKNITITDCIGRYDLKIEGEKVFLKELFTTMYGLNDFVYRFFWFYDNDKLSLSTTSDTNVSVNIPNKLHKSLGNFDLNLYDIKTTAKIKTTESNIKINLIRTEKGFKISLKFFAKLIKWVVPNSIYSYPNILFGFVYGGLYELFNRI